MAVWSNGYAKSAFETISRWGATADYAFIGRGRHFEAGGTLGVVDDAGPVSAKPPGWYNDPIEHGIERYWDGTKWLDRRRPSPASIKEYRLTAFSVLAGASLVVLPILGGLFSGSRGRGAGEGVSRAVAIPSFMVVGVLLLAGLWWLRTGRFSETVNLSLVGVGLVVFGLFLFWLLFIPTALALIVLWFGIVKRGLVTELRPAPDT